MASRETPQLHQMPMPTNEMAESSDPPRDSRGRFMSRNRSGTVVPPGTPNLHHTPQPENPNQQPFDNGSPLSSISTSPSSSSSLDLTETFAEEEVPAQSTTTYSPVLPYAVLPLPKYIDRQPQQEPKHENPPIETLAPTPSIPPRIRRPMEPIPKFNGDPTLDKISSKEFLKDIRIRFEQLDDATKLSQIDNYFRVDSPAEAWYESVGQSLETWREFEREFMDRFPSIVVGGPTQGELERRLLSLSLSEATLGSKESFMGKEVWTHMAFAEKALGLAKQMKIHDTAILISSVRGNIPASIRSEVPTTCSNWTEFTDSIKALDRTRLEEKVKEARQQAETYRTLAELRAEVRSLRDNKSTRPAPSTSTPSGSTTSQSRPPPRSSSSNAIAAASRPRRAYTDEEKAKIRAKIAEWPKQPNTPEGNRLWALQVVDWNRKFPGGRADENTGFPIEPTREDVRSGECWKCGQLGHQVSDCKATGGELCSNREFHWRRICTMALGIKREDSVNAVLAEDDKDCLSAGDVALAARLEALLDLGKEQGPTV